MEILKKYINLLVIGGLIMLVIYQGITSRKYQSQLEQDKKQLMADLDTARAAQQSAIKQLDKLKEGLQLAQNTANAIGTGINTGESITSNSGKLIDRLKGLIKQLPTDCRCGDIKP